MAEDAPQSQSSGAVSSDGRLTEESILDKLSQDLLTRLNRPQDSSEEKDKALAAFQRVTEIRAQNAQRARAEGDAQWSRGFRRYVQALAPLAIPLTFLVVLFFLSRPSPPVGRPDGDGATAQALDRLTHAIELAAKAVATNSSNAGTGWPVWALVLAAVAVAGAIGAALWAIFRSKESDGLTKILSTAIVSIGGLLAISKLGKSGNLPPGWGDVAYAAILATLVCVGLAVSRKRGQEGPPAQDPENVRWRSQWQGLSGSFVVVICTLALVAPAVGTFVTPVVSAIVALRPGKAGPISAPSGRLVMRRLAEIKPFPSGIADPDANPCRSVTPREKDDLTRSLADAAQKLEEARGKEQRIDALLYIASTDRGALVGLCREKFLSNRDLAQARGEWVATQLKNVAGPITYSVVVGGPTQFGTTDQTPDRNVTIYGLVNEAVGN